MKIWTALNLLLWVTALLLFFIEGYEKEKYFLLAVTGLSTAAFFSLKALYSKPNQEEAM